MSDAAPQAGEPTMEEILASIRRIISEEEVEAPPAAEAAAEPESVAPVEEPEEEILELTDVVPEPPAPAPAPAPAPRPRPSLVQPADDIAFAPQPEPELADLPDEPGMPDDEAEGLIAPAVIDRAASAFVALERDIAIAQSEAGKSLEGLVRAMIRPMLKQWLDTHLPDVVERVVRDEVARVASRRR